MLPKLLCLILVLIFLLPSIAFASEQPYAGVWHFDETEGNKVVNSVTGEGGQNFGAGISRVQGIVGNGLRKVADTRVITDLDIGTVDFSNGETIEAWFFINIFPSSGTVYIVGSDGSNNGLSLGIRSAGYADYQLSGGGGESIATSKKPETGTWHYIAGVYNGTHMCLWLDGAEDGCREKSGAIRPTGKLDFFGTGSGGDIILDEVRIANKAADGDYFKNVYKEGVSNKAGPGWYGVPEWKKKKYETIILPGKEYFLGQDNKYDGSCGNWPQGCTAQQKGEYLRHSYYIYYRVLIEEGKETPLDFNLVALDFCNAPRVRVEKVNDVEVHCYLFYDMPSLPVEFDKNGEYRIETRRIFLNKPTRDRVPVPLNLSSTVQLWGVESGYWDNYVNNITQYHVKVGCCGYEEMIRNYFINNTPITSLAETLEIYEIEIVGLPEEQLEDTAYPFAFDMGSSEESEESTDNNVPLAAGIAGAVLVSTAVLASGSRIKTYLTAEGKRAEDARIAAYASMEGDRQRYARWLREEESRKAANEREIERKAEEARLERISGLEKELQKIGKITNLAEAGSTYALLAREYSDVLGAEGKKALMDASSAAWIQQMEKYPITNTIPKPIVTQPTAFQFPETRGNVAIKTETSKPTLLDSITSGLGWFAGKASNVINWVAETTKPVVKAVANAVSSIPVVGQSIVQAARGIEEFAYGLGKSVYNTVKGIVYDLPVGIYNWATTTTDPMGDIGRGIKYVADGAVWAVTHPAETANIVKDAATQAWTYCTSSAENAGECAGEVAQLFVGGGTVGAAAKAGRAAKIANIAEKGKVLEGAVKHQINRFISESVAKDLAGKYGERVLELVEEAGKSAGRKLTKKEAEGIANTMNKALKVKKDDGGEALSRYLASKENPITNPNDVIFPRPKKVDVEAGRKTPDMITPKEVVEHTKLSKTADYSKIYNRIRDKSDQLSGTTGKMRTVLVEVPKDSKIGLSEIREFANDLYNPELRYMLSRGNTGSLIDKIVIVKQGGPLIEIGTSFNPFSNLKSAISRIWKTESKELRDVKLGPKKFNSNKDYFGGTLTYAYTQAKSKHRIIGEKTTEWWFGNKPENTVFNLREISKESAALKSNHKESSQWFLKYATRHEMAHQASISSKVLWEKYLPIKSTTVKNWILNKDMRGGATLDEALADIFAAKNNTRAIKWAHGRIGDLSGSMPYDFYRLIVNELKQEHVRTGDSVFLDEALRVEKHYKNLMKKGELSPIVLIGGSGFGLGTLKSDSKERNDLYTESGKPRNENLK